MESWLDMLEEGAGLVVGDLALDLAVPFWTDMEVLISTSGVADVGEGEVVEDVDIVMESMKRGRVMKSNI